MGLFDKVTDLLFGKNGGATYAGMYKAMERDSLSAFLPWETYDPETEQYGMQDGSIAFMWECSPLFFAGESTTKSLEGLFRQGLSEKTTLQFVLTAEPHVTPLLQIYARSKTNTGRLVARMTESISEFYDNGKNGLSSLGGMPLRNFRMFVIVKFPTGDTSKLKIRDISINVREVLKSARLNPRALAPEVLLDYLRRLFNDESSGNNFHWDEGMPLRKQCIFADTLTEVTPDQVTFGKKIFKCITPMSFPKEVHAFQTNQLFGGVMGMVSDGEQIRTPFIYSLNIVLKDMKGALHTKCNFVLVQQGVGSFAPSLMRKKHEYMWAVDEIEKGTKFYKVIPSLWIYGEDPEQVAGAVVRTKQIWEGLGYVMQVDKGILMPLFLTSLPGGLFNTEGFVTQLDRDFVAPVDAITEILPIQGDFSGFGEPIIPLIGRKGQLFGLDLWAHNSHNALICATTGGGKSFLMNYMLNNYYSTGAKIRVVDIGGSYKKMVGLHGARFLDFAPGNDICLNPFSNISEDPLEPDDTEGDIMAIPGIIALMCYSLGEGQPSTTDMTLIEQGVRWAYTTHGRQAGSNEVRHYLANFRKYNPGGDGGLEAEQRALMLAFNMAKFTTEGPYGRFFNGPATFNIADDDFVVLELEHLEQHQALFKVVTLQVINAVTQDLYLGDKSRKKLIIFDEAWRFLGESSGIKSVIEQGYRRARKYEGSFTIITQSLLDMVQFGSVGKVIRNNSAFKFYLKSTDFEQALNEKLIDYSPFVMDILKSVNSNAPLYSEIFIDSPFGIGVGRLSVDPFNYYANTSTGAEVEEIDNLIESGMPVEMAIDEMVRKYRS